MDIVTFKSTSSTTNHHETGGNHREASFSSYLNGTEESFILQLKESNTNLNFAPHESLHIRSKKNSEDREIDVFSAEKYFNDEIINEENSSIYASEKPGPVETTPGPIPRPRTPSIHSESSSNSRKALLRSFSRGPKPVETTKRRYGRSLLSNLGCNCSCRDGESVQIKIDEHVGEIDRIPMKKLGRQSDFVQSNEARLKIEEPSGLDFNRKECFSFPVYKFHPQQQQEEDDTNRKSLEVFGTPVSRDGKRISMLNWDSMASKIEIPKNPIGLSYNDTESDSSSDLFEIDSFSNNNTYHSGLLTPTTCYAPSEVSIDWSIVTASAADFSILSDSEELRPTLASKSPYKTALNAKNGPMRLPGLLSGCKSHKAVSVAVPEVKKNGGSDRMTRFQAESKIMGFDSRKGRETFNTRSQHSRHGPNLLYI